MINFVVEFEEYTKLHYLKSLKLVNKIENQSTIAIITLEGQQINLQCYDDGIFIGDERYENMEQILNKYSPLYVQKFQQDLYQKLCLIKDESSEDEEK